MGGGLPNLLTQVDLTVIPALIVRVNIVLARKPVAHCCRNDGIATEIHLFEAVVNRACTLAER